MNPVVKHTRITFSTTGRILRQLQSDPRTIALIMLVPVLLLTLLYFMFADVPAVPNHPTLFQRISPLLLGVIPFFIMFLITSITMQRERSSGTLERILSTPLAKLDLLLGYALAFSLTATVQAVVTCVVGFQCFHVTAAGGMGWIIGIAVLTSILGVSLGLLCSAFARTEFQAVQFMPVVVVPQMLLCGIIVPRPLLPGWMEVISNALPLSYTIEALQQIVRNPTANALMARDLLIVGLFILAALFLAAATLRRRTP